MIISHKKGRTCEWDILEKKLNKGAQKSCFNFQRLKIMVRRGNIACKKAHICSLPIDYIAVREYEVFCSTSAEIYSGNWLRYVNYVSAVVHIP